MANVDSFGTFLESLSRREKGRTPSKGEGASHFLRLIADSGPESVPDLLKRSGLSVADFMEALTTLREAGLISLGGEPGNEIVRLTSAGEEIARLPG